jgi:hypothetical protein
MSRVGAKALFGLDLTRVPGIHVGIARTLFGEIGPDFHEISQRLRLRFLDRTVSRQ